MTENLNNPNKSRAKGPSGRKLPTRKKQDNEEVENKSASSPLNDSFKSKLSKCLVQKKQPLIPEKQKSSERSEEETDLNIIGTLNQAEFNKVWFFRVPSTSALVSDLNCKDDLDLNVVSKAKTENNNVLDCGQEKAIESKSDVSIPSDNSGEDCDEDTEAKVKMKKKIWKNCQIL